MSFTKADAPELLLDLQSFILRPMDESSLVVQARAVFIGIALLACLTVGPYAFNRSKEMANAKGNRMHLNTVIKRAKFVIRTPLADSRSFDTFPDDRVSCH